MELKTPVLIYSAILYPNGEVITGRRHSDVMALQARLGVRSGSECVQGFVDNTGKFYNRLEARELAVSNGQISLDHTGELYSEDLWPGPKEIE